MELSKKTTILFSPALHEHLAHLARRRGVSLGHLVREACEIQYGGVSPEDRMEAASELAALCLPVAAVEVMKAESVTPTEEAPP